MGFLTGLGKHKEKGDVTELADQVKGTFGSGDIIERAESLKGLLTNGAGLLGRAPGAAGVVGKAVSGGVAMLDKGSDLVKTLTGTSGYDWLGTGAAKAVNAVSPIETAKNASAGYGAVPEGMKRIFVNNEERIVPKDQVGPGGSQ